MGSIPDTKNNTERQNERLRRFVGWTIAPQSPILEHPGKAGTASMITEVRLYGLMEICLSLSLHL